MWKFNIYSESLTRVYSITVVSIYCTHSIVFTSIQFSVCNPSSVRGSLWSQSFKFDETSCYTILTVFLHPMFLVNTREDIRWKVRTLDDWCCEGSYCRFLFLLRSITVPDPQPFSLTDVSPCFFVKPWYVYKVYNYNDLCTDTRNQL